MIIAIIILIVIRMSEEKETLKAYGKFIAQQFKNKVYGKATKRFYFYVDPKMAEDPRFPFRKNDMVLMKLENNRLIITRVKLVEDV